MPTDKPVILSEEQLSILIRGALVMAQRVAHSRFCDAHPMGQAEVCKSTTEAIEHLDALCATVRALREKHLRLAEVSGEWAKQLDRIRVWSKCDGAYPLDEHINNITVEHERLKASRRVHELDNHHNALACGYCAGPLRDELARLQARLKEVEGERDQGRELFKNACRLHTSWTIDRYLMSNAENRRDPAEKAQRHIELCQFYVAAVRGCSVENALSDYERDFDRLHEQSQELTSSLDTEIGFPLDQTPDYDDLNPKFFERFHAIACRVLGLERLDHQGD